MTGEVGTGKTLLVRCLLRLLARANVAYAYVFNPLLSPLEFLQYIAGDFQLPAAGKSKSELLLELSSFVIARYQKGLATVLVLDEAHHLSAEVLEEVRLLTNLETPEEKLLQILLVGQPELDAKLDSVSLRQLKQRVALRSCLGALTLEETCGYIYSRLRVAGSAEPAACFPTETIAEIYLHSHGIPRLINTLCENALIHAYGRQVHSISPEHIVEIAADLRLNVVHPDAVEKRHDGHDMEVEHAARTLLDIYDRLRRARDAGGDLRFKVGTGAREHESYI